MPEHGYKTEDWGGVEQDWEAPNGGRGNGDTQIGDAKTRNTQTCRPFPYIVNTFRAHGLKPSL